MGEGNRQGSKYQKPSTLKGQALSRKDSHCTCCRGTADNWATREKRGASWISTAHWEGRTFPLLLCPSCQIESTQRSDAAHRSLLEHINIQGRCWQPFQSSEDYSSPTMTSFPACLFSPITLQRETRFHFSTPAFCRAFSFVLHWNSMALLKSHLEMSFPLC